MNKIENAKLNKKLVGDTVTISKIKKSGGSRNPKGPKPPRITLSDDCECNFKLKSKGPQAPEWFASFANEVRERFDKIESRLDEHDKMFKAHGWTK